MRYKNGKEYWSLFKSTTCQSTIKANISTQRFAEYCSAVNDPQSTFFQPDEDALSFNERFLNCELQIMFNELESEISHAEIERACKQLKDNISGGDFLINEFIKYGYDQLAYSLFSTFNTLFNAGYFPDMWTEGHIIPLHKKETLTHQNIKEELLFLVCLENCSQILLTTEKIM